MHRAVKGTMICSAPKIFKNNCKLFMCAKGKHKRKGDTIIRLFEDAHFLGLTSETSKGI